MADLIGLTASAAGGGVFGLLGTALGRVSGYFERRQHHAHERARWGHESELLKLQMQAKAIGASYPWVNAVRGLTRPALTVLLWIIAVSIYLSAGASERAAITETATFAATAATLWWFGDRGPRREPRR